MIFGNLTADYDNDTIGRVLKLSKIISDSDKEGVIQKAPKSAKRHHEA